jgi:hypothetical protein
MSKGARNPALDGLRGVAVLLLPVHHFAAGQDHQGLISQNLYAFANAGWIGVGLLFVLLGSNVAAVIVFTVLAILGSLMAGGRPAGACGPVTAPASIGSGGPVGSVSL